jgi:hypothetical protein
MWDKARRSGPALALLAGSGALMLFGRLLVRVEPAPAGKAAVSCRGGLGAAGGGGVGAAVAAVLGYSRLRDAPLPVPAETARETAEALRESDGARRRDQGNGDSGERVRQAQAPRACCRSRTSPGWRTGPSSSRWPIFRGLLDGGARDLSLAAQCAAARAIAEAVPGDRRDTQHIVPDVFDEHLVPAVARAVMDA